MLIGYARNSTGESPLGAALDATLDATLDMQVTALHEAGCSQVFTDEAAAGKGARYEGAPGLQGALGALGAGDTLVVWRLDRLGRSLKDLVQRVEDLRQRQAGLRSLHEGIDTTSASRTGHADVFLALAAFERDAARERAQRAAEAGRSARARGRMGGRPKEMTAEKLELAVRLMKDPEVSISEICRTLDVSKSTLYRYVGPDGRIRGP